MQIIKKFIRLVAPLPALLGVQSVIAQVTPCDSINSIGCKSIVTDTAFNPYVTGVLGNWRPNKTYTYFSNRAETDPSAQTDIRRNGTFNDFSPFWAFQNSRLNALPDTLRWIWNNEITLYNRKGVEIEDKDPMGRYNTGLYGYNLTLPVAVIQNSRARESAFEGFEDYGFVTKICDTSCPPARHFDFSGYISKMDTLVRHTGKSSLKLRPGQQAGIIVNLAGLSTDSIQPVLKYTLQRDTCAPGDTALKYVRTDNKILLPVFKPVPGKKMVLSAWVRDSLDCKCTSFTHDRIVLLFPGIDTLKLKPTGNIIEGWQRYENVFDIPAGATNMIVSLESTDSVTVYFDDVRFHPFNANMKSFVFHPVNLRLMAELDENNYATFYEYDDDGTLIRVKKETQRGIKTIKETRSALLKDTGDL